jgi:hypothetical protein
MQWEASCVGCPRTWSVHGDASAIVAPRGRLVEAVGGPDRNGVGRSCRRDLAAAESVVPGGNHHLAATDGVRYRRVVPDEPRGRISAGGRERTGMPASTNALAAASTVVDASPPSDMTTTDGPCTSTPRTMFSVERRVERAERGLPPSSRGTEGVVRTETLVAIQFMASTMSSKEPKPSQSRTRTAVVRRGQYSGARCKTHVCEPHLSSPTSGPRNAPDRSCAFFATPNVRPAAIPATWVPCPSQSVWLSRNVLE